MHVYSCTFVGDSCLLALTIGHVFMQNKLTKYNNVKYCLSFTPDHNKLHYDLWKYAINVQQNIIKYANATLFCSKININWQMTATIS